jgi:hypothetical protein
MTKPKIWQKSTHFEIFIFIQHLPKKCDILRQIYLFKKLQKASFKNSFT